MSDLTMETEKTTSLPAEDCAPVLREEGADKPVPEVSADASTPEAGPAPEISADIPTPEDKPGLEDTADVPTPDAEPAQLVPADPSTPGAEPAPYVPAEGGANRDDLNKARKVFSRLGLTTMLMILVGSLCQVLATSLSPAGWQEESWFLWGATFAPLYLVAFPMAWLLMRKIPVCRVPGRHLGAAGYFRLFPICVFMMLIGNYMGIGVNQLLELLRGTAADNPIASYAMQESLGLKLLFLVVLAPLMEELLFRRWLIDRMRPYGERLSMVTSALMFALFHGNFSQFFYALTLGLVFGYVYLRTGRLRYSVGLHMFINFIGSILSPVLMGQAGDLAEGGLTSWRLAYSVYSAALLFAGVAGMVLFLIRLREVHFEPAEAELPRGKRFRTAWFNVGMGLMTAVCIAMFFINIFGI